MALEEADTEKHEKILSLKLRPSEWERAGLFIRLLAVRLLCLDAFDCHISTFGIACGQCPASLLVRSDLHSSPRHSRT
jgi:hypothetical protein